MAKCTFLVGIASAGKSTWAHKQPDAIVLDSDDLRAELFNGDATYQGDQNLVFNTMYRRAREYLSQGKNVILSSTNLSMRYRLHAIRQLSNIPHVAFHAVVFNTPLEVCKAQNKMRDRQVPDYLFEKQIKRLQLPVKNEGYESIEIYSNYGEGVRGRELVQAQCEIEGKVWKDVFNFGSQRNKHHTLPLYDHCVYCGQLAFNWEFNSLCNSTQDYIQIVYLVMAARLHDIGKVYTATYSIKDDGQLSFPCHANYGAYLVLNMGYDLTIAQLINYHMTLYENEKAQATWHKRLGDDLWNQLSHLHAYDAAAH